jgi:hypothetical protein
MSFPDHNPNISAQFDGDSMALSGTTPNLNQIDAEKLAMTPFKHVPHNIVSFLRYFKYDHLPSHLQPRSKIFHDLAWQICHDCEQQFVNDALGASAVNPDWAEIMVGLRNLLIAKDNVVRAFLPRTD